MARLLGTGPSRRARFDLLVYWGRHPGGWSTRAAIRPQTRLPGQAIDQALTELVEEGLVRVHQGEARPYYSLLQSPEILTVIKRMGRLTPRERQALLRTITPETRAEVA